MLSRLLPRLLVLAALATPEAHAVVGEAALVAPPAPFHAPVLPPALAPFLQSWAEQRTPTATAVNAAMREADVSFLEATMPTAYAGYEAASRAGFSWSAAFAGLRELSGTLTIDEWQARVAAAFSRLDDQHLGLQRIGEGGSLGAWSAVAPRPERSGPPRRDRPRQPTERRLAEGVHVLAIHDFFARDQATWKPLRDAAERLRGAKTMVVDLRGNGGGDDDPFYRFLVDLTGKSIPTARFRRLQTPLSQVALVNLFTRYLSTNAADRAWQERSQHWHDVYLQRLATTSAPNVTTPTWDEWDRADSAAAPAVLQPFQGRFVVLVDRFCASACELAVKTLKSLPGTVVAGEPTAGMAVYGDNFARRMPGSGLAFFWGHWQEMDLAAGAYGFREGKGFVPDVAVSPESLDADAELLRLVFAVSAPKA